VWVISEKCSFRRGTAFFSGRTLYNASTPGQAGIGLTFRRDIWNTQKLMKLVEKSSASLSTTFRNKIKFLGDSQNLQCVRRWSERRLDFASTAIRLPFDCNSTALLLFDDHDTTVRQLRPRDLDLWPFDLENGAESRWLPLCQFWSS